MIIMMDHYSAVRIISSYIQHNYFAILYEKCRNSLSLSATDKLITWNTRENQVERNVRKKKRRDCTDRGD